MRVDVKSGPISLCGSRDQADEFWLRTTGALPGPKFLTGSHFGFSIKRRTEDAKDRRKHGVQLIQAEQDEGTTADGTSQRVHRLQPYAVCSHHS